MTLNRWKVLACTLTVGVGGLAVFATDPLPTKPEPAKEPAALPNLTVKPATPPGGTDTPPPIIPVKGESLDIDVPLVPALTPAKPEETKKPASEPVFEPIVPEVPPLVIPVKGEADPKDTKKAEDKVKAPPIPEIKAPTKSDAKLPDVILRTPDAVLPPPISDTKKPSETPKIEASSKAPPIVVDVPTLKVPELKKPEPTPPTPLKVETPPVPPVTLLPEPVKKPAPAESIKLAPTKPADGAKLKLTLRMGDGDPRFEIRNSATTDLLLKVYGQKIELKPQTESKATVAGVTAMGKVRFTAPGIEGTCEHLTIMSATGEVLLEGDIRLKTKHGKVWSEISADRMVYQIGTAGLMSPGTPRVTPASFTGE